MRSLEEMMEKEIEVQETQIQNIETFIHKASQYVGIEELTSYALHELIKAIYVDAPAFRWGFLLDKLLY